MGDDADYYLEQQEADARFNQLLEDSKLYRNRKPLICWTNCGEEEIWSWEPLARITEVFSDLYESKEIGKEFFLASRIPDQDEEDELDLGHESIACADTADQGFKRIIDGWEFHCTTNASQATHEVIVVSPKDAPHLKEWASQRKQTAESLRDEILSEMFEEMAWFIECGAADARYIFSREL